MAPAGRPKKPAKDRKTAYLGIVLTAADRALLVRAANGMKVSAWARERLLEAARAAS